MAITIIRNIPGGGSVSLPDGSESACSPGTGRIEWRDRYTYSPVVSQQTRTLDGKLFYRERTAQAGQPVTLEARLDTCWLSESQKDTLIALAETPGPVEFDYDGETHTCIFDHPAGAVQLERKRPASDDWWIGTIRLITLD